MIVLDPQRLGTMHEEELEALMVARECVVAIGEARLSGPGTAALLMADYAAAGEHAVITIDSAAAWAGVVWRAGGEALRLLSGRGPDRLEVTAADAVALGLIDELFSRPWEEWMDRWLAHRSTAALDAAALLAGRRGGDALERAEFARLFATGEPQRGMDAFLRKRRPQFGK